MVSDIQANSPPASFTVHLVAPSVWQKLMDTSFQGLPENAMNLASRSLLALHNRHVGITPALMAQLAPMLINMSYAQDQSNPWAEVFARLLKSLYPTHDDSLSGNQMRRHVGLAFSGRPAYTLLRLAAPLVDEACRRLGSSYLFCGEDRLSDIGSGKTEDYERYDKDLTDTLVSMARDEDDETLSLFWVERALTLSSLTRQDRTQNGMGSLLPEPDSLSLGLLLRLQPDTQDRPFKQKRVHPTSYHRQQSTGQQEGDVVGITVTRNPAYIGNALLSEYLHDPFTRAERMLEGGFLILDRQPKRTKPRDLLLVGMMPGDLSDEVNADLVKSCWFDLVMRFGFILSRSGLRQTEFRWVEGDSFSGVRDCSFLLKDMLDMASVYRGQPTEEYRRAFMDVLRWMPRYVDQRDNYRTLPELSAKGPTDLGSSDQHRETPAERWLGAAWGEQQEATGWSHAPSRGNNTRGLRAEEFEFTHVFTFLPRGQRGDGDSESGTAGVHLGGVTSNLKARRRFAGNASITWVPKSDDEAQDWRFDAAKHVNTQSFLHVDMTLAQNAGKMVDTWLEQLLREIPNA